MYEQLHTHTHGKFLGTSGVWINSAPFSYISRAQNDALGVPKYYSTHTY